jgi:hypothetical protein
MNSIRDKILDIPGSMPAVKLCVILRYQNLLSSYDIKEIREQWEHTIPHIKLPKEVKVK